MPETGGSIALQRLVRVSRYPARAGYFLELLPGRLRSLESESSEARASIGDLHDRVSRSEELMLLMRDRIAELTAAFETAQAETAARETAQAAAFEAAIERERTRIVALEEQAAQTRTFHMQVENLLRGIDRDARYKRAPAGPEPVRLEPDLHRFGCKTHSQNDEDGVIGQLFERLGGTPGFFVEFGVGPPDGTDIETYGLECNSRLLQDQGWRGLYMDGRVYPETYGVHQEFVTALNIDSLLDKYGVPLEFDFLSIDLDGQDFWVWMAVQRFPRLVVIEYNPAFLEDESFVVPFDLHWRWDGTQWYGASLLALSKLGTAKGYVLVYANGVNAFFVRRDLVANIEEFPFAQVFGYRGKLLYHRADPLHRIFQRI